MYINQPGAAYGPGGVGRVGMNLAYRPPRPPANLRGILGTGSPRVSVSSGFGSTRFPNPRPAPGNRMQGLVQALTTASLLDRLRRSQAPLGGGGSVGANLHLGGLGGAPAPAAGMVAGAREEYGLGPAQEHPNSGQALAPELAALIQGALANGTPLALGSGPRDGGQRPITSQGGEFFPQARPAPIPFGGGPLASNPHPGFPPAQAQPGPFAGFPPARSPFAGFPQPQQSPPQSFAQQLAAALAARRAAEQRRLMLLHGVE